MALAPKLEHRLSQSLVMTPQLRQAIKLLQYSSQELGEFVDQELERNPLLERREHDEPTPLERPAPDHAEPAFDSGAGAETDVLSRVEGDQLPGENQAPLDADYGNVFDGDGVMAGGGSLYFPTGGGRGDFADPGDFEDQLTTDKTLSEHLRAQIGLEINDPAERLIADQLIGMLDEAGYLHEDIDLIAGQLGCATDAVEAVLLRVQRFEPAGVFARSLKECLQLQLADRDRLDPAMEALLENLDVLAAGDLKTLGKVCEVDAEDLADMIAELRALDPKPGLQFEHDIAQTLIPDVFVRPAPDGGWFIELNTDALPRVLVNRSYHAKLAKGARSKDDRSYVTEQLQTANWLVRSLDQRANTILKVATELVNQQGPFFTHGVQHLRPLTLRDIADQVDMHESTVSRVTTNKYIATPRGVFEMKYFFSSAIASSRGGEAHSAEAVRHRIKLLIDNEKCESVLSDDGIVEILKSDGIDIARRTVAKYRDAMRIPSSVQRRRLKTAQNLAVS